MAIATRLTVRGCCPLDCQDTCSWLAHVEDGRVVKIEGDKEHPLTRGALCAKVNDYEKRPYAPDRLLTPLRRTGPKGSGEFEPVGWDEALDLIAERFRSIIQTHGAEALLPLNYLGSMGVVQRRALMRIFNALGASRFHGSVCGAAGNALADEGHPRGFDPEEFLDSRFVLLWGCNLLSTSHHQWHFIQEAKKRHGARVVSIDPIRTRTAKASDEHVPIRPGSDQVLAAAFARVMFAEGLADLAFAGDATVDLEAYAAEVEPWTPERAEEVCGVAAETVVRLAKELGTARPALIRCGIAPQQSVRGEALLRSLSALAILGGHWRLPGGGLFIEAYPVMNEAAAARPDLRPGEPRSLDMARLGELLDTPALDPPVMGLMIWTMNPAVTQPDAGRVQRGLAREDLFTVVIEHFLTDTARYADVVLPSTTQFEHFDLQGAWGHHYISLNEPAIAPLGEALSHGEIMRRLAPRLGLDHPAFRESDEEIAASALPPEVTLEDLKARGWLKHGPERPALAGAGLRINDDVVAPPGPPGPTMLQLLTPKSHFFLNSTFANMDRQRRAMKRPSLQIHPDDASARGIGDGEEVEVSNERGALRVHAEITDAVSLGVVALPGKWWGAGPPGAQALANLLSASAWSQGGQPAFNETFVEVAGISAS